MTAEDNLQICQLRLTESKALATWQLLDADDNGEDNIICCWLKVTQIPGEVVRNLVVRFNEFIHDTVTPLSDQWDTCQFSPLGCEALKDQDAVRVLSCRTGTVCYSDYGSATYPHLLGSLWRQHSLLRAGGPSVNEWKLGRLQSVTLEVTNSTVSMGRTCLGRRMAITASILTAPLVGYDPLASC